MLVRPKILLVEDDEIATMVVEEMLSDDYWVKHADSGQAALDYFAKEIPNLVLLDVDMPEMNGYEVCRAMRANPAIGNLPVIFLSGMVDEEDRRTGYEAGGNDYLTKPFSADDLCSAIQRQLNI